MTENKKQNNQEQPKKHAIILSGGGADGAYEIGVLKALFNGRSKSTNHKPIEPEIFCGTSVGAFNCAFLVSHWEKRGTAAISDLEDVWRNYLTDSPGTSDYGVFRLRLMDPRELLDPRAYLPNPCKPFIRLANDSVYLAGEAFQRAYALITGRDAPLLERAIETLNVSSIIDRSPLTRTIERWIDFAAIREAKDTRKLRIAATNWATGKVAIFYNHEMTDKLGLQAILASTAIPAIFPMTKVGSQPYLDGGVVLNTPLGPAIQEGATDIHVIYLSADVKRMPLSQLENTMTTVLRQQFISWARACHMDIEMIRSTNKKMRRLEELENKLREKLKTAKLGDDEINKLKTEKLWDDEINKLVNDDELRALIDELIQAVPTARKEPKERAKYRMLTIHRYYPHENLSGVLGMLDFSRKSIEERIERGFNDASNYDPRVNKAVGALAPKDEARLETEMIHGLRAE